MSADLLSSPWFWLGAGYLLGSIPFGLVLTFIGGKGDVRKVGSGNIGTTNVLRAGGKWLAALTLIFDAGKGALAVWLGGQYAMGGEILAGMGAFVGHCFPIFLLFRGGKGVATFLGIALALEPLAGGVFAGIWILAALLFRFSSLAGLAASIAAPVVPLAIGRWDAALLLGGMAAMVIAKHEANIGRLLRGEEPKIGRTAKTLPEEPSAETEAPEDYEADVGAHRGPRLGG
jgi:glycerol-3-phosphate acyltransferase PlsY